MTKRFLLNHRYLIIFIFVALVHVSVLALVRFTAPKKSGETTPNMRCSNWWMWKNRSATPCAGYHRGL